MSWTYPEPVVASRYGGHMGDERREMSVSRIVRVSPERAWTELTDAWVYTSWVVGATHIRDVDENWPEPGSKLYHTVGPWPLTIKDHTEVLEADPPRRLVLNARAWPVGEARIELTLEPVPEGTKITIAEWPVRGPGAWTRNPLMDAVLRARNRESLGRLAALAEHRPVVSYDRS
jgi:uncharacterized protein YndB with AHSA1/START domain